MPRVSHLVLCAALVLVGCGTDAAPGDPPGGPGSDGGGPVEKPVGPDGGSPERDGGALPDAGPIGDGGPDAGGPPPGPEPVRFVVMGDTGEGNQNQRDVSAAIEAKCAADGCDFVVLTGDNIYNDGVSSVDDAQWQTKFEDPYANLDLPFYVTLGNHDYGGKIYGGFGDEFWKGPLAVEYTDYSDKWILPWTHYTFTWGNVGFVMLDTNSLLWDNTDHGDQWAWYSDALLEVADADWVFAAGHHPYKSNGQHGNAGSYFDAQVVPILRGTHVKSFFDQHVCGTVDLYFAGHDHNRQWLAEDFCGAELVVSGAGAKLDGFGIFANNDFHFQDASEVGFLWVEVVGDTLSAEFIGADGEVDFERTLTR